MKKLCYFIMAILFSINIFAEEAAVAGVKVNQSAQNFRTGIAKKFTKVDENHYKGTFAGYPNSIIEVGSSKDGWISGVTITIPTDGTYENGKKIVESLLLAYNKKYGTEYNRFRRQEFGNFCYQLCNDEICITIYIYQDNTNVGINYVVMKRDSGIKSSDI